MDDEQTKTQDILADIPFATGPRVSLVLYHQERVRILPLLPGRPIVVGRSHSADERLLDENISRRHTRFERLGQEIWDQLGDR